MGPQCYPGDGIDEKMVSEKRLSCDVMAAVLEYW